MKRIIDGQLMLSERLERVISLVPDNAILCDVGCDHGYVPIVLIQRGICDKVLAMDVVEGPLSQARKHVSDHCMEDRIVIRRSDGLEKFCVGDADVLLIAGMGGPLMLRILQQYPEKTTSFRAMILQPQSEIPMFRREITRMGYRIEAEAMVKEDGKYYPMMRVVPSEVEAGGEDEVALDPVALCYGPCLLAHKDTVLFDFLKKEQAQLEDLLRTLETSGAPKERATDIRQRLENNLAAQSRMDREEERMVTLTINGKEHLYEAGLKYEILAKEFQSEYEDTIALVSVNGKIRELMKKIEKDATIEFLTYDSPVGHKTYVRTAIMLLLKAIQDVLGQGAANDVKVEFTIGKGYYCSFHNGLSADPEVITRIEERMKELVDADLPITKKSYPLEDAIALFSKLGMQDKVRLFEYRRSSSVNVYCLGDYYDYFYGYMLPSTGYVTEFHVIPYDGGLMLLLPQSRKMRDVDTFVPREKLFETLTGATLWHQRLGIDHVGDLNDCICNGSLEDMILVQEALQERRITEIASDIAKRNGVKFVMIAGPSSSGKTSFSYRLSIQLRTFGLNPHPIALDNYYLNHDKTPRDENGEPDYECLEALDVEQFNQDMTELLSGKEVELPTFNFKTGKREYKGDRLQLGADDILVIEGIHGLNEKMSYSLPSESKYKIYISALTSLNIDRHNRIPTTDGRLLRRMVRDARTRGASAQRTIGMWKSVRAGEEKYIFPFQEEADAMFNSATIYELAALKPYAEPLLFSIKRGDPEYYEAKRLLKFLDYFLPISSENLPNNSICREFVGGSCFNV